MIKRIPHMKMLRSITPLFTLTAILSLNSCKTEDPSAAGEIQRDLAQAIAKSKELEEEVASLTEQLELAQKSSAKAETMKMPTRAEIEQSLAIEGTKLQQVARDLYPDSKVASFGTFDLDIPSFEAPFSCKAKVQMLDPSGVLKTLYWTGNANMKGEWKFEKAENLEPQLPTNDTPPVEQPDQKIVDNPDYDIPLTDPIKGQGQGQGDSNKQTPKPKAPEPPEVEYDITLDNPLMGPKGR